MEKINSDLIAVGRLLKQSRFSVPPHQRPYAWGDEQILDLYRDINDAKNRAADEEYFLGTVVFAAGEEARKSIIDGQQRLVTTSILIAGIRDHFANAGQDQRAADITQEFLSKREIRSQEETAYLHLSVDDRDFFLKRVILLPSHEDRTTAPVSQAQQRIARAIELAEQFLKSVANGTQNPDEVLLDLLEFIDSKALLISVEVSDEANAYIIFEVLNDRGLDLSVADLLKNYVFRLAGDRLAEAQAAWLAMTAAITTVSDEREVKSFVRQAWISSHGLTREKQLYAVIKKEITTKAKAIAFAKSLADQAVVYAALRNTSHDRWKSYEEPVSEALEVFSMVGVTQIRPLLLAIFSKFTTAEVNRAIPMLVAWTVRFLVFGSGGSGTLEAHYSDRAKSVSRGTITTARQLYNATKDVLPSDQEFMAAFTNATVSKGQLARFYLRVLELETKPKDDETIVNPDAGKVNLEHVMPQSYKSDKWGHVSEEEHSGLVRRLGNLALMDKRLNAKVANSDFATKKPHLASSSLELTKMIATESHWGPAEIERRQTKLAALALKAWPSAPKT